MGDVASLRVFKRLLLLSTMYVLDKAPDRLLPTHNEPWKVAARQCC